MALRRPLQVAFSCLFLATSLSAQDRFGVRSLIDATLGNNSEYFGSYVTPSSRASFNGQVVLASSLEVSHNLSLFYEGRLNHQEELPRSASRIQETSTHPVLQGYLRYTPNPDWDFNVQAGKFGSPFGDFLTRNYSTRNPLIGSPLIYTYETNLYTDRIPKSTGAPSTPGAGPSRSPVGSSLLEGLPLLGFSYPTGLMASGSKGRVDYRIALVNSSLANTLNIGTQGQRVQWVAGGGFTPLPALRLGVSLAEGPYLDPVILDQLPTPARLRDFSQRALGIDLQYDYRHLEVYGELVLTDFQVPTISRRLGGIGYYLELKHTWTPRIFSAVRWNQLHSDRLPKAQTPARSENRDSLEVSLAYRFKENMLAKIAYQYDREIQEVQSGDHILALQWIYAIDLRSLLRTP